MEEKKKVKAVPKAKQASKSKGPVKAQAPKAQSKLKFDLSKIDKKYLIAGACALVVILLIIIIAVVIKHSGGGDLKETTDSGFTEPTTTELKESYSFVISDTSLFVKRDGSILSAEVQSFDKDYYDVDEFESEWLVPAVKEYNNEKNGVEAAYAKDSDQTLGAAINSLTMSGKSLVLQMDFATPEDFLAFNQQENVYFASWKTFTVTDLDSQESLGGVNLVDADGNTVTLEDAKKTTGLHLCTVGFGGDVPDGFTGKFVFEGAVKYVSEGANITDANAVTLSGSTAVQYIIFE